MNNLTQQISFILELDRLKSVYRQTLVKCDDNRFENSAEHSWHIAMLAITFQGYANTEIDMNKVIHMLLLHDIVEIDAGDTFAFAHSDQLDQQEEKELEAAKRIFGLLPRDQYEQTLSLWLEFEAGDTVEAQFAKGMDRILPLFQNMSNQGGSWAKHKIKANQVLKRNAVLKQIAPRLWSYVEEQVNLAVQKGWLLPE